MDFDGLKGAMIEMLSGDRVPVDVTSFQNDTTSFANKDDVITYLIHLGYLGYDQKWKTAFVPNEEIRQKLTRATKRKKWNELVMFQQESEQLLNRTLAMDGDAATALQQIKNKRYPESILSYTGDILLVGINYDKDTKEQQCLIEKYEKD